MVKRFSFIGDGLSHVAFGAVAIAAVLQITNEMPLVMVITIISAVSLLRTGQNTKIKGDTAIAMISVGALAVGYLLMNIFSTSSNLSGDVCSTLFGSTSILTLSPAEVWLCVGMSVLVMAVFILFYNKIFAVTFDESFARATGTKAGLCNLLIAVIVAVIIVLGEVDIPTPTLTEGVDIRLTASRQGENEQVYELLVGDLPPKLMTDPSPPEQPLQGDAFGLQMEGHVSLTISRLALSSITLSAKSVTKNGNAATDLVLTKEEDAIPGSISSYNSRNKTLTLSTDKEYPGIPRELSIPAKYLDTVFFAEQNKKDDSRSAACHSILMKDGSRLHGNILSMDSLRIILRHPQLGQISLPLKNITRVEFLNSAQPSRSTP